MSKLSLKMLQNIRGTKITSSRGEKGLAGIPGCCRTPPRACITKKRASTASRGSQRRTQMRKNAGPPTQERS